MEWNPLARGVQQFGKICDDVVTMQTQQLGNIVDNVLALKAQTLDKMCEDVLASKSRQLNLFDDEEDDHKSNVPTPFMGIQPIIGMQPRMGMQPKMGVQPRMGMQPIAAPAPAPSPSRNRKDKLLGKSDFPSDFVFGTAASAYQYEGAAKHRGENMWDAFARDRPDLIEDYSNGNVAQDFYHRYKEDVKLMKDLGLDAFRFSICWSRIFPTGRKSGGVNQEGVKFYNNLINEIVANGMKPFVTLLHFDVPERLQQEYGGFLDRRIVEDFRDYAGFCFWRFGDRVKHWITINEPLSFSYTGYAVGSHAPGRCTPDLPEHLLTTAIPIRGGARSDSLKIYGEGNSATEPYIVSHNQLLAHAAAARLYKRKYQAGQRGLIGITNLSTWMIPFTETQKDRAAAFRALDFMLGWFMDPLTNGYYPKTMQALVGDRLPKFSREEAQMVKGSFDFIGINYYTSSYVRDLLYQPTKAEMSYQTDSRAEWLNEKDGKPIGKRASVGWQYIYPQGILDLLRYIKNRYNDPLIYITENGLGEKNDGTMKLDSTRVEFHYDHLAYIYKAIKESVRVKGYFAWSFLDNFEWDRGYTIRFGLFHVDYENNLERYENMSALWYSKFLKK